MTEKETGALRPEEYKEPACPFDSDFFKPEAPVERVPVGRILCKLDEYLEHDDQAAAGRHLSYWLAEAKSGNDLQGELAIRNERMGYFRKNGLREEALEEAEKARELLSRLRLLDAVTGGTTLLNIGTVYNHFGMPEKAVPAYEEARRIYEEKLSPDDARMGGLYNNTALAYAALGRYREAGELYRRALSVMEKAENGELERAVTLLNLANAREAELGLEEAEEEIAGLLERAETLLRTPSLPRNGYYAFTLSKCAPTFAYYGWFAAAKEFEEESKRIYERT